MDYDIIGSVGAWAVHLIATHGALAVFLCVLLFGESGAIAGFALAAQGSVDPWAAFAFAYAGSLSADIFWYWMTERIIRNRYEHHFQKDSRRHFLLAAVLKLVEEHLLIVLTFIKFLVGLRLFLTVYIILKERIKFRTYLLINIIGTALFMGALFPIGWLLGEGVSSALKIKNGITTLFSLVIVAVIFSILAPRIVRFFAARLIPQRYADKE